MINNYKRNSCCYFLGFLTILSFYACKKSETPREEVLITTELKDGLPADYKKLNGFFYAQRLNNIPGYYWFSACFCDPQRNLLKNLIVRYGSSPNQWPAGNIDVGDIIFNDEISLQKFVSSEIDYRQFVMNGNPQAVTWAIDGNGTFKPFNVKINRGFPVMADTIVKGPVLMNRSLKLNPNVISSNYDSLHITIGSNGNTITKVAVNTTSVVVFTSGELKKVRYGNNCTMTVIAFNYSYMIIENKMYVFEQACVKDLDFILFNNMAYSLSE